jgi:hypothetical protein
MASLPIRDPLGDHLLTPQSSALLVTHCLDGRDMVAA